MNISISDIGLLVLIVTVLAGAIGAIWWIKERPERLVNKRIGIVTIVFAGISLILAFIGMKAGTLYINISEDPKETVEKFYNCVLSNDYEGALANYKGNKKFAIQSKPANDSAARIKAAYEKSFAYEIKEGAKLSGFDSSLNVDVRFLDLEKFNKYVADSFGGFLAENIMKTSKSKIYDGKNNYKQEFLDLVYEETLADALNNAESFYVTQSREVTLNYSNSNWIITYTDPILAVNFEDFATRSKVEQLNNYLAENKVIYKSFKIEGDNVPVPNANNYGVVYPNEVDKVLGVINQARESGLLDGQEVSFRADSNFMDTITYYYDESILAISWNEWINGSCCSFSEIKIADPSQFRRKLADDTYGSSKQYYCTTLAKQSNAVVAMNADFYGFRGFGTTVYDGEVRRVDNALDGLYIDDKGNFNFIERGNDYSREQLQDYVDKNNVDFALAFGPILVRDGNLVNCSWYPIGEVLDVYSRAGIAQLGELHYLYLNVGHYNKAPVLNVNDFARILYSRGAIQAYNLDGGQTGELVMNDSIINYIDWGNERPVSDIIYFATAMMDE